MYIVPTGNSSAIDAAVPACRYVADAESSSIRLLDTRTGGSTLVAGGDALFADNLFRFGDRDGPNAELQHPLAVACSPYGNVYIADSYNHKIKRLSSGSRVMTTIAGTGTPGFADGPGTMAQFSEPGGLVVLESGEVLIADTNNSVIRRLVEYGTGVQVSTVLLQGVPPVASRDPIGQTSAPLPPGTKLVRADALTGTSGVMSVQLRLEEGFHLTVGARSRWRVTSDVGGLRLNRTGGEFDPASKAPTAEILYTNAESGKGLVRVQLEVYFCRDGDVCLLDNGVVEIPMDSSFNSLAAENVVVTYSVTRQADAL